MSRAVPQERVLGLLNQHSMAMLACVARTFRDHVRSVRLHKRTLVLAPGVQACVSVDCPVRFCCSAPSGCQLSTFATV